MRDYELVLILSPDLEQENLGTTLDKVSQFVTQRGGAVTEVEQWGRRRLAYPIRNHVEGIYVLARLKFDPRLTAELEGNLKISEEVLRHLLVRLGN